MSERTAAGAPVACPAALADAALSVEPINSGGTEAEAALWASSTANAPPEKGRRWRAMRRAKSRRARVNRPESVPCGQPT